MASFNKGANTLYISVNGKLVRKEEASISPFDHGYLYGLGLFETFRIYNGHPFLLDDHLARLKQGLDAVCIRSPFNGREELQSRLADLLERNQLRNARIRVNVSAGIGEVGLSADHYVEPTVIIFANELPEAPLPFEKNGKILSIRRNTPEGAERLKSHHFLNNILAKQELGADDTLEGIFLTKDGFLAEGISSNVFWTKGNVLYTPAIDTGILNGITRQFIIKIAKKLRLEIEEGVFHRAEIVDADEVFITNSIQEIVPLKTMEGRKLPGLNGAIVTLLQGVYKQQRENLWSRDSF